MKNNNSSKSVETKESFNKILPSINKINLIFDKIDQRKLIKPQFREYKINNYIKTNYAYVTLLIIDETYLPGILILGYSLKKYNNNYNLICLVQDKPVYK